jgi:hypothetical protein
MPFKGLDPARIAIELAASNILAGVDFALAAHGLDAEEVQKRVEELREERRLEKTRPLPPGTTTALVRYAGRGKVPRREE